MLLLCFQLAILLPSLPLIATPSQPKVMEPVVMRAHQLLLLLLLQLLPSLMVLSQGTLPNLHTQDMVNRLLPLHHRGMCTCSA